MINLLNTLRAGWTRLKNFIFRPPAGDGSDTPAYSHKMEDGINLWYSMYVNEPPWASKRVRPLGLPAAVCREIARPVLVEFKADITGGARAQYLLENFEKAQESFLRQIEMGLALGGVAFKPYPYGDRLLVDATGPALFTPQCFDAAGICVSGVFKDKPVKVNQDWYIRLEYHELHGTTYTICNKAYRSDQGGSVGAEVSLANVPEWAEIAPEITIEGVDGPLFAYFKPPINNNVDASSDVGVSVYSGATVDLIRQADEQWSRLLWEFESGQRKIFMDGTTLDARQFDRDLFELGMFNSGGDFFNVFSPEFRNDAIYQGLQAILRQIEFQVGLYSGSISDPQTIDRSATEVRSSKQRMFVTVDGIQKALGHVFDTLIYAMDVYATLYGLAPVGEYEVKYDWGDSVLEDEQTRTLRYQDMRADVAAGLIRGELYVADKYGVTEEEALKMMPGADDLADEEQDEVE